MADDNYQRPYGGGDRYGRAAPRPASNNDPLAELARLIGQNDPFAEFGRAPQQQAPQQQQNWGEPGGGPSRAAPGYEQGAHDTYAQPGYESAPATVPGYDQNFQDDGRYDYYDQAQRQGEETYDDVPPKRSRLGIVVIACVVMLAVVGTAVAFGYRALFGSSGSSPPPVIKADTGPSKVVPPAKTDTGASKQFNDRVGERSAGEKLVSREEQPMERPQPPAFPMPSLAQQAAAVPETPPMQSLAEPKRVRTIAIKPDGQAAEPVATAPPSPPVRTAAPRAPAPQPQPVQTAQPPQRMALGTTSADAEALAANAPPPARPAPAPAPSRNAPLSLAPEGSPPPPARTASAPARVTPAPVAASAGSGQYGVQVSSQRSEAEAQAAYRALQAKFPAQLGGHQPVIRRADLGDKGVYYRAMVPFSSGPEALALCNSLKSAGGSCIIQKN